MKWIELAVEAHPEAVDAIAEVFRQHGTGGVSIEQTVRSDEEGQQQPVFEGMPVIKAYLPVTASAATQERQLEEALWHLQAFNLAPVGTLQRREIDEEDWAHSWKEHFHPLKIGRIVVKPTWREWEPKPDELVMELDPGMAFGTGLHPTTRLTLSALQKRIRPGMRVLDLGTGSAILAIAAGLLGANVTGLDISEVAVDVARRNVELNQLSNRIEILLGSIEAVAGTRYDLLLVNIIATVLVDLAKELAEALVPGAVLIGSGIIAERVDMVRDSFRKAGLVLVEEEHEGDWWLIVAQRPV